MRWTGFEVALGLFRGREPGAPMSSSSPSPGIVTSVEVKPTMPTSDWVWGMAAARRRCLDVLASYPEPGAAFNSMSSRGEVVAVLLSGPFDDLGTREVFGA